MTTRQGFKLLRDETITELNTQAKLYRHVKTGAEILSLANDDENKAFGVTFRTPPSDSTGLPHILEHSVLCGSRKYPVKEPFIELVKGSLKTFLNAFTYPDRTCYPVASTNQQDFYNLVDVYLDAVFFPLIPPETLQQEGWHYELENLDAPLTFKGVVFNEMKGAYSSSDSLMYRYSQQTIFPDNTYGVDSGGDPQEIPNLTYEQFKDFHETYYHPGNAYIYFYGDDPEEKRLALLEPYLDAFEARNIDSEVALQPLYDQPRRFVYPFDASDDESGNKHKFTVNWLLKEIKDQETVLGLSILSYILVGTPASPLRKVLIDSGLGEDLTGGGLGGHLRQMTFSTGMKGVAEENVTTVETLILDTLKSLAEDGIEQEMIEAAMNTVEFRLRESNTGSFPRGLSLMLASLTTWLYGDDPLASLRYEAPLKAIKDRLASGEKYFESLIKPHLINNQHRTTVVLEPDPEVRQRLEAAEAERLAQARAAMSEDELKAVIENAQHLKELQETPDSPEALAALPRLELSDLNRENKPIPISEIEVAGNKILHHDLFTNGIVYLGVGFNMRVLPQELLPYFSLFSLALLDVGTETEDFVQLSRRIGRKTGGIWASPFSSMRRDSADGEAWLFMRGKSTMAQANDMLAIMRDVLLTVNLDNIERMRQLILEEKSGLESSLIPGGHGIVGSRLAAKFNVIDWADEQMDGLDFLFFLRDLVDRLEQDWPSILGKMEEVRRILFNRNAMLCDVTLDEANWQQFQPKLAEFQNAMPASPVHLLNWAPTYNTNDEGLTIPAQVNYVGKGTNLYDVGYKRNGSTAVITNFIRTTWLWEKVRVQGGAYGGSCGFDYESGVFNFSSYRDPNLIATLDNYDQTGNFLRNLNLSQDELTKSIIGAISAIDAYRLPDAKGRISLNRYLIGITDEERQQFRDEVLSTTAADFKAFGDVLDGVRDQGRVVVLGSQDAIAEANNGRGDWLKVTKVL